MEPKFQTLDDPSLRIDADRKDGLRFAAMILAVVLLLFGVLTLLEPGQTPWRVTRNSVEVDFLFRHGTTARAGVDLGAAKIVDIDADAAWRPAGRTGGYGGFRYSAGWFRTASGASVEMYKARDEHRCVVLPRTGAPPFVVCSVQPEALLNELRTQWTH